MARAAVLSSFLFSGQEHSLILAMHAFFIEDRIFSFILPLNLIHLVTNYSLQFFKIRGVLDFQQRFFDH
jgi:hypothetical protein